MKLWGFRGFAFTSIAVQFVGGLGSPVKLSDRTLRVRSLRVHWCFARGLQHFIDRSVPL